MNRSEISYVRDVLVRRWIVIVAVVVIGFVAIGAIAPQIPVYKARAQLLIVSQTPKDTTLSDPDLPSIITSSAVLGSVIDRLQLRTTPAALSKNVKTKLPPKSSMIELTYSDTSPTRATAIANAIADEASAYFHEIATRGYADVLASLEDQISRSRAAVAAADEHLQVASAANAFASSDKALDDLTSQIGDLEEQQNQIDASLSADSATAAAFHKQLGDISDIVEGEILQKDNAYQQVEAELGRDIADLVSERSSFQDGFPGLAALENRVFRERAQADTVRAIALRSGAGESPSYTQTVLDAERADGVVAADKERLAATERERSRAEQHLRQVAVAGAAVGTLRAERDASLQRYITLSQRLSAAQGDAAQAASLGSLVVISHALPGTSDVKGYFLGMAVLVIVLAIASAFAFDALDRRLWGSLEIERVYGRPVLAEVGAR